MVGSNQNCIKFFKIQAGAQLKPFFGGFETRLNSLNLETELKENSFTNEVVFDQENILFVII